MKQNFIMIKNGKGGEISNQGTIRSAALDAMFYLECTAKNLGMLGFKIDDDKKFYFYDVTKSTDQYWIKSLKLGEPYLIWSGEQFSKIIGL